MFAIVSRRTFEHELTTIFLGVSFRTTADDTQPIHFFVDFFGVGFFYAKLEVNRQIKQNKTERRKKSHSLQHQEIANCCDETESLPVMPVFNTQTANLLCSRRNVNLRTLWYDRKRYEVLFF